MKWIMTTAIVAGLVLVAATATLARPVNPTPKLKPSRVDIRYGEPKSADYEPLYKLLKDHQALEKIRDLLRPLSLPHRVLLQVRDCDGISNAFSNEDNVVV